MMGMSRSSTCVLAYLMLKQEMSAVQALKEVRRYREVRPNDGFLRQLADLDNKLRKERERNSAAEIEAAVTVKNITTSKSTSDPKSTNALSSIANDSGSIASQLFTKNIQKPPRKLSPSVTWK